MPRFQWLEAYELTFFQSLVDSIRDGLHVDSSLKPDAWLHALKTLQDTHGISLTKSQLSNKYDNSKKRFRVWRALREHPGFGYDLATKCVTAPHHVWDEYLEKHPKARQFRGRPLEHEDFFNELFPDVIITGRYAQGNFQIANPGSRDSIAASDSLRSHSRNNVSSGLLETSENIGDGDIVPFLDDPSTESGSLRPSPMDTNSAPSGWSPNERRRAAPDPPPVLPRETKKSGAELLADSLGRVAEAVAPSAWKERAMDLLWKDFEEKNIDLQLEVAEALKDEATAILFCKMPLAARKRWMERLRRPQ